MPGLRSDIRHDDIKVGRSTTIVPGTRSGVERRVTAHSRRAGAGRPGVGADESGRLRVETPESLLTAHSRRAGAGRPGVGADESGRLRVETPESLLTAFARTC